MYADTHAQARTTPAMREAIQHAEGSIAELARRFGVSEQTIRKWRGRTSVADRSHRPERLRTTLDATAEDLLIALRVGLRLPLDGLLAVARAQLHPAASRSAIDRSLRRRGANRLDMLRPALQHDGAQTLLLTLAPIRGLPRADAPLLLARSWPRPWLAMAWADPAALPGLLLGYCQALRSALPLRLLAGDECEHWLPGDGTELRNGLPLPRRLPQFLQEQYRRLLAEPPGRRPEAPDGRLESADPRPSLSGLLAASRLALGWPEDD